MFEKIKEGVIDQAKVRRCEVEGMVRDVEKELEVLHVWRIITFDQLEELLALLH